MVEGLSLLLYRSSSGRGFMDGPGSEKTWAFYKVILKSTPKARPFSGVREHAPLGKFLKSGIRL